MMAVKYYCVSWFPLSFIGHNDDYFQSLKQAYEEETILMLAPVSCNASEDRKARPILIVSYIDR